MPDAPAELALLDRPRLEIVYRNWRGEVTRRVIVPRRIWFGSTEWHPREQWLMDAFDTGKGAERSFALKDFIGVRQLPATEKDDA